MAEYIELTEELMLAMNAGARAIENTKRYHGAVYTKDVFADNSQEIPYLLAAKVLREVSDAPAADVATVVRCKGCKHCRELNRKDRIEEAYADGVLWCTNQSDGVWPDDYCSYGERRGGEDG